MDKNRRIAVIGSGISGASAAWLLRDHADVTLFERGSRFGGHTHTFHVEEEAVGGGRYRLHGLQSSKTTPCCARCSTILGLAATRPTCPFRPLSIRVVWNMRGPI